MVAHDVLNIKRPRMKHLAVLPSVEPTPFNRSGIIVPVTAEVPVHRRTVGIDLAISAVQVAQIFDEGRAVGKPIRFRLTSFDLKRFVDAVTAGCAGGNSDLKWAARHTTAAWPIRASGAAMRMNTSRSVIAGRPP
ncbi:hypothetical protein [Paraburkholderia sp. RL17-337-BIB-A]|uniref:hypothetical protein n=1 Tax=Paraburkholderia sp. RL17-337-BIB-A TaxID=3031636 RepID=UPI0038B71EBB